MNSRHVLVDAVCENCGETYQVRRSKLNAGKAKYCSKGCFDAVQRNKASANYGYEKAKPYKAGEEWKVWWYDDAGKYHSSSYSRWIWEMANGKIPDGFLCMTKDGNRDNIVLENLELVPKKKKMERYAYKYVGKKLPEISGEKNPNWKGGLSKQNYPQEFSSTKQKIYSRDDMMCRICHTEVTTESGRVHHIDADKSNNSTENLLLTCKKCHSKIHSSKKTTDPIILAFRSCLYA